MFASSGPSARDYNRKLSREWAEQNRKRTERSNRLIQSLRLVVGSSSGESVGASAFIGKDNPNLFVSAEDGRGFADYYGEFRGGYTWIDPKLEAWAKENGGYWEWQNPGCIVFSE